LYSSCSDADDDDDDGVSLTAAEYWY